jgi:hypothetical protein
VVLHFFRISLHCMYCIPLRARISGLLRSVGLERLVLDEAYIYTAFVLFFWVLLDVFEKILHTLD